MARITIIGTGNMGQAIAAIAYKGAHDVQMLGQADADTDITGDIVILAVPYPAVDGILDDRNDQFDGRVVVDVTNPLNFETFDELVVPADSSAAAEIADKLPNARVVKAFNTSFAGTLSMGNIGDLTTTVLIAGDDSAAKNAVADIVSDAGLRAIDVGSLKRARELEALGFLQITLAAQDRITWTGGFGLVL